MGRELIAQSWTNLTRNRTRSLLTMLGIVWGIVAVTVLLAYGSGFRAILTHAFDAFGRSAVVAWPGQTSEQAGGERAGRRVKFEKADRDVIEAEATLVKGISMETVEGGRSPTATAWPTPRSGVWSRSTARSETRSPATAAG